MADWQDTYDGIINKLDAYFDEQGWYKNEDDEWTCDLVLEDPSRYIGDYPLKTIMEGRAAHVYGTGAEGVASFCSETWVSEFEENFTDVIEVTDEEYDWLGEDEGNWDEVSSYIQGWVRPQVNVEAISQWLAEIGY